MDFAGSAVGIISLGIQVCQGLVQYYGSWKDAPKDTITMCKEAENLTAVLLVLQDTIQSKKVALNAQIVVQNSIEACRSSISQLEDELNKVQEVKGGGTWAKIHDQGRRLLYPFREGTLLKLRGIVADIRDNLSLAVDALHLQATLDYGDQLEHVSTQVQDVKTDISTLKTYVVGRHKDQESQAIIDWLSPLNFFATQNDTLHRRQDGTGEWLFETPEFQAWLSGAEKVLWCSGMPGAGKTILASAIIDKLERELAFPHIAIAFLYCNYKESATQTLSNLIGSLVQQLVHYSSIVPDEVRKVYNGHESRGSRPNYTEYSRMLQSLSSNFLHIYCIVDALDECTESNGTRSKLIKELQIPENLHLLCTSRNLGDIEKSFEVASRLEIRARDEDIRAYLKARISDETNLVEFCQRDESLQNTIIEKLVRRADGMFLLAQLHFQSLATKLTAKKVRKALETLPDKIDQTYTEAIERIQKQNEDKSILAFRILSWIIYARRPLKVGEIQHAVAIMDLESDENDLDEEDLPAESLLISVCGGLLVSDPENNILRLVHYTAEEYFWKEGEKLFPDAELKISLACIRYLSMDPFMEGPCKTDIDMQNRLQTYSLLEYSAANWGDHIYGILEEACEVETLEFLNQSSLRFSAYQALVTSNVLRYKGWSQNFATEVPEMVVAAIFGLKMLVEAMLKLGNDIEGQGSDKMTALLAAAVNGHEGVVRFLLEKGADIEAWDSYGGTALILAAGKGEETVVRLLLKKGAHVNAQNFYNQTALMEAVFGGYETIIRLLLKSGSNIDAQDRLGRTALHLALIFKGETFVRLLLEEGANTKMLNYYGNAVIHAAAERGYEAVVRLLLEKEGSSIEDRNAVGWTALLLAAQNGRRAVVQLLLEKGAKTETQTWDGRTALELAANKGEEDVIQLLLKMGAYCSPKFLKSRARRAVRIDGMDETSEIGLSGLQELFSSDE